MSFLSKRSFVVKAVRDQDLNGSTEIDPNHNPFEGVEVAAAYADVAKDLITHAALTIGGVWAACKIVERICK
jgi:hypothetical protein